MTTARRTLFDIGDEWLALDALLDDLGGDVSDPAVLAAVEVWHKSLSVEEAAKLDSLVNYLRTLETEASAARAEAEQYLMRAKSRESRAAWLKQLAHDHLVRTGRTKATTSTGRTLAVTANGGKVPVKFRDDFPIDELPADLVRVVKSADVDKVRAAIEAGADLSAFAWLGDRGTHLRIRG